MNKNELETFLGPVRHDRGKLYTHLTPNVFNLMDSGVSFNHRFYLNLGSVSCVGSKRDDRKVRGQKNIVVEAKRNLLMGVEGMTNV